MAENNMKILSVILAAAIIISIGVLVYVNLPKETEEEINDNEADGNEGTKEEKTVLTLIYNDEITNYTLSELQDFEAYSGSGRYIKQKLLPDTVLIEGPFNYTGVEVSLLLNQFSDLPGEYIINVTASDGWSSNYTSDNVAGIVDIYNESGIVVDNSGATMILAYEENDELISDPEIGPLRIAFVNDGVITSSSIWTKMVEIIEVI